MVFKSQNLGLKISSNTNTKKKKKKRRSQTYEDATAPSSVSIWNLDKPVRLKMKLLYKEVSSSSSEGGFLDNDPIILTAEPDNDL